MSLKDNTEKDLRQYAWAVLDLTLNEATHFASWLVRTGVTKTLTKNGVVDSAAAGRALKSWRKS